MRFPVRSWYMTTHEILERLVGVIEQPNPNNPKFTATQLDACELVFTHAAHSDARVNTATRFVEHVLNDSSFTELRVRAAGMLLDLDRAWIDTSTTETVQ